MPRDTPTSMAPVKDSTTMFGAKFAGASLTGGALQSGGVYPGGLDLLTPSLVLHPGACRDMQNFEVSQNGGYGRIGGYERYSGQPAPSDATFAIVQVLAFVTVPSVGAAITQASSGATGTVALVNNQTGAYYMVVTETTGTFDTSGVVTSDNDSFSVTAANSPFVVTAANSPFVVPLAGTVIGTAIPTAAPLSAMLNAQYQAAAADIYRDAIGPVPGSGPVLATFHMVFANRDQVYGFRANTMGTAVDIHVASPAGWVLVPLQNVVSFTGGNTATPMDGDTLTQGPATATIKRVVTATGAFSGSAAGVLVVTTPNLGFSAGPATTSSGTTVILTGPQTPIVIRPGGTYEWDKHNFSGQLITRWVYGCDGVNPAFCFDGETYAPIASGLSPDAPSHMACHKGHLILAMDSSMIFSGDGVPFRFSAIDNGGEIATGDEVTAMLTLPGNQTTAAMGVWMNTTTGILYGTGQDSFNFVVYNQGTGGNARSVQNLFDTIAFPDIGIVNLQTSLNYGNFDATALTKNIQPFVNQQRSKISASAVNRSKGQYRVFFNDGYGLYLTFAGGSYLGAAPVLFPNPVGTIDDDTDTSGNEVTYFGSSDALGYVYQLDIGPSFDGEDLFAYFTPAWDYIKSPEWLKRFRRARIEVQGTAYAAFSFNYALGDNSPLLGQPSAVSYTSSFSPALWDAVFWDNFFWDGQTVSPTYADMTGTGQDVQPTISSATNYIAPFIVSSIIYQYSVRRRLRGL